MRSFKRLFFALVAGTVLQSAAAGETTYTARVEDGQIVKTGEFSCHDHIYVYIESDSKQNVHRSVFVSWRKPSGATVRYREREFIQVDSDHFYAWDGVVFRPGGKSGISGALMNLQDPSAGLEDVIGRWRVRIDLPGKDRETVEFNVLC